MKVNVNTKNQYYKGIRLNCIARRRIYAEYYKRQRQAAARRHAHSVEGEDWTNICLNG